ncbi:MAG: patatin-like phospholipase family protein [Clostridia bacterium]|nr:patatin-like phospholipase family protein [Clostridia bacterium]
MRRAIVFGGGGSKGAYQYGAWKALRELGQEFDIAVGTSIGAINAGFYVQDDFEHAGELWTAMNLDMVMKNGINLEKSFSFIYDQRENILPMLKTYFKDGPGADITPFLACIDSFANEEKFFASPIDYGLITVRYPDMQPLEILKKDIAPGYFAKWVCASCACFPAFPRYEIDGKYYLDGGYYDNLPIATAMKMGAEEVVVLDLHTEPIHPAYQRHPYVKYLLPSRDLGSFLCFTRDVLDGLIDTGYLDTLRAFGKLGGSSYYITVSEEDTAAQAQLAPAFLRQLTAAEIEYENQKRSIMQKSLRDSRFTAALATNDERTPGALLVAACEVAMTKANAPRNQVYTFPQMLEQIKESYRELRDLEAESITDLARAICKMNEEKGFLSDLRRSDPTEQDYITAALTGILFNKVIA